MTYEETLKIFAVMKANYNNFYKTMSKIDAQAVVSLWAEMFADVSYNMVGAAVKAYIASDTTGYPPNVGQINEQIRTLTRPEEMTEQEAANLIMKAASNGYYGAQAEFDKLPPVLQRLVGHPNQLKTWAMMDENELQTVVASNLMRSYRTITKREAEKQALPASLQQMLETVAEQLKIEG